MSTEEKIIKNKVGLLKLSEMLGSVSEACKVMGYSRDSFYRFKELYEKGGELALREISRRKPCPKNRVEEHVEKAVIEIALEKPAFGQVGVANELTKRGLFVSPTGVRSVWLRHDLETFRKRLKALEAKAAQEHLVLSEDQLRAMERAREEKGSARRNRNRSSRLLGHAGHLLRGHDQERRPHLSADFPRHLRQGRFRQTL
jgi:transposase